MFAKITRLEGRSSISYKWDSSWIGQILQQLWENITTSFCHTKTISYWQNRHKVWDIKTMKKMPREDEARKILKEVARQVEPIMMKHGWRIKLLSEFRNREFLGLNIRRKRIKLHLRHPCRGDKFIPFILIIDTMLHELCHNVHKEHNASFDKLLDQLRKEYEEFVREGIIKASSKKFDLGGPHLAERLAEAEKQIGIVKRRKKYGYWDFYLLSWWHEILVNVKTIISRLGSFVWFWYQNPEHG